MKKFLLLILVIVCANIYTNAQTWPVYYGTSGIYNSNSATPYFDYYLGTLKNIMLTGFTNSEGAGGKDMYVVKTDLNGNEILSKTYGSASDEVINSISPFARFSMPSDPMFVVGGYSTINGNKDIYVQEIDTLGNKVVDSTIIVNPYGDDELLNLKFFNEGYIYGAGYTTNSAGNKDFYYMKLEEVYSPFTVIDSFSLGGSGDDIATSIDGDVYGNKCLAGYSNSFSSGDNDIYIVNYDEMQGVIAWDTTYGGAGDDFAYDILLTSGGYYIVVGSTTSSGNGGKDVFIMKLDSYGSVIWQKTYGGTGNDEALNIAVQQGEFDNYIISGYTTSFGSGDKDAYLLKINLDGDTLWTKVFGQSGIDDIATTGIYNNCEWYVSGSSGDQMFLHKFAEPKIPLTFTTTDVSCYGGNDGYILLQIPTAYANGMMTYNWSNDGAQIIGVENTMLISGIYSVTVNDGFCETVDSVEIFEPTLLTATHLQLVKGCYSDTDKVAVVTPSGGTPPYGYNWLSTGSSDSIATMLSVGIQNFEIWDSNGCTFNDTIAIFDSPAILEIVSATQNNVNCPSDCNGSAKVIAEGGSYLDGISYTYLWSDPATQTTDSISNLCTGGYSVTVTDGYQCSVSLDTIYIDEPSPTYIDFGALNASCNGSNDGMIKLYYIAGFSPFTFNWSNGSTDDTLTYLTPGIYTVTVTDSHGCMVDSSYTISEPPAIVDNAIIKNISCFGNNDGSIKVFPSGGVPPYYYFNWSNASNNDSIANLSAGNYSLTINDITGCLKVFNYTITEPSTLSSAVTTSNVACYGDNTGSATITASGGTSPYNYLWSNGFNGATYNGFAAGSYTVTITDANGCSTINYSVVITQPSSALSASIVVTHESCYNSEDGSEDLTVSGGTSPYIFSWSNAATTEDINNLPYGTYSVTISDLNNCQAIYTAIVNPAPFLDVVVDSIVDATCGYANGSANIGVLGGYAPISYSWTPNISSGTIISNVVSGTYHVVVTDSNGCKDSTYVIINDNGNPTLTLTSQFSTVCYGSPDTLSTLVSNGTPPYNYVWDEGSTTSYIIVNPLSTSSYSVYVIDANGCISQTQTKTVNVFAKIQVTVTTSDTDICEGDSVLLTVNHTTGAGAPYSIIWNNGIGNTPDLSFYVQPPFPSTTYVVTVTDICGLLASDVDSITITTNQLSTISGTVQYTGGVLAPYKASVKLFSTNLPDSISGSTLINNVLTGSDSKFYFTNVPMGEYIIKVLPTDTTYPTILATYYDTTLLSQYAIKLNAECGINQDIVVNMKELQPSNPGTSSISGYITIATTNKSIMGEPIPGAEITLEQEPDDEPIAFTETNSSGFYKFQNLSDTTYSIIVDIPGFPQLETHLIAVDGDTTNVNYIIDTDTSSANFGIYIDSVTLISKYELPDFSIKVYPNPFNDNINLDFNLNIDSEVNIDLIDFSGKKVETLMNKKLPIGNFSNSYQLSNLSAGTYLIKMKVGNTVFLKKILKN